MNGTTTSNHALDMHSVEKTSAFLEHLFPSPRSFAVRLCDGQTLSANGKPKFTFVINSPGALRRMVHFPLELSFGEAYIRGDFDVEGDIFAVAGELLKVADSLTGRKMLPWIHEWLALPNEDAHKIERDPAHFSGELHSKARDKAAVDYHYNVGNDFYALWLDKRMIYSCAYFATGTETIDTAQELKLDLICRKLRLRPGEKLLDIGCGWGGLVIYAAEHYGVNALGVTLSEAQFKLANQRIAEAGLTGKVEVKLLDYRDISSDITFDKLVSVGMFEHVGPHHMSEYFAHTYRLLAPGGLFLNHGISIHPQTVKPVGSTALSRYMQSKFLGVGSFNLKYVFPDSGLMPVSQVNLLAENTGFEVRDVESLREHYALTLRQWVMRLEEHQAEALRLVSQSIYRIWKYYMATCVFGFESGAINVNQTLLAKPENGHSNIPLSRADIYQN